MLLEAIGFSEEMPAHMDWAHVVVGKAGGLTVTEALTAGRPLVLCGAIPGNESANASYVVGGGAGVTALPSEVARVLHALRAPNKDPRGASTSLRAMAHATRQLVTPAAADDIVRLAYAAASGTNLPSAA
jgi:UDP-N-acetylglucosamine:LPS N-acetylglucosamine transferase